MPSKELLRLKIGTHEIRLSCCGGPGQCETGGGVLNVSKSVAVGGGKVTRTGVETCLPFADALMVRNGMNELLLAMAAGGKTEQRAGKLQHDVSSLESALVKAREEMGSNGA